MPLLPLSRCPTCRDLPPDGYSDPTRLSPGGQRLFAPNVDFEIRENEPVNVVGFSDLGVWWRDECSRYTLYRCPLCGTCYRHEYHFDSGGGAGPPFELQELVRLDFEEAREILAEQRRPDLIRALEESLADVAEPGGGA